MSTALEASTGVGDNPAEVDRRKSRRLQLFIGARLGVATLLLGGTLLLALGDERGFDAFTPQFLVTLIGAIYASSLVFLIWLLGSGSHDRVANTQVGLDLLLTSGLVYVTGGASSAFSFLFGINVLMAAMVVGPRAARGAGAGAILGYGAIAFTVWRGWLRAPPDQNPETYAVAGSELAFTILLNLSGLFLVTLLAATLAARLLTAGGQLRQAEASAASLARLNDDIVRSMTSGLISTDLAGHIRTINPMGVEMLGASIDELLDMPVDAILPVDINRVLSQPSLDLSERAEGIANRPDGQRFPVGYSVSAVVSTGGDAIGALVLFTDLTEVQALRLSSARQERLAVLGRLSAGLAHEIRNPLSSISGSVELVRDSTAMDDEDTRLLNIVIDEVDRLDELVSTMLEVGKPREPLREEFDLRRTVRDVAEVAARGPAAPKQVTITPDTAAEPVMALADAGQVRQVLWNLVKNALEASPPESEVHVRTYSAEDGSAVVEVSDEGAGIDNAQKQRVYDMFHSERTHGSGIGLALVRQIVDAHDGTIEIMSGEGRGATFIVRLPGGQPHPGVEAEATSSTP